MTDTITLTGIVGSVPNAITSKAGVPITSFRLASTQRRYDRSKGEWVDGDTSWFGVNTFRQLAANASQSIEKGDRVIVTGRVRLRDWTTAERRGTSVEVDAEAVGHDLSWGTATWVRTSRSSTGALTDSGQQAPAAAAPNASDWGGAPEAPADVPDGLDSEPALEPASDETPF